MSNLPNVAAALKALRSVSLPYPLMETVRAISNAEIQTERDLLDFLSSDELTRQSFALALGSWDQAESEPFSSPPGSPERREETYALLGLSADESPKFTEAFPRFHQGSGARIVAADWNPWYENRELRGLFYWTAYQSVLKNRKGWDEGSIQKLDTSTTQVVERLANPTDGERYQSKGLVVGYVQSGKTAHFTGVIAKAIDAGYRLVLVLAGMHNMLRSQTQRRLDMELVGVQNIRGGADLSDSRGKSKVDYASFDDSDWLSGKFVEHDVDPFDVPHVPRIIRLSRYQMDYRSLVTGLDALETARHNPELPLFNARNLERADVRLLVVKKNSNVLRSFIDDLNALRLDLDDLPALVIDDEADQASINTAKPDPKGKLERTKINAAITDILKLVPRSQYIAYTATPFANVFVDAEDAEDLFPRDFIFSLEAPPNYMGGRDFHDFGGEIPELRADPRHALSNERAHVRRISSDSNEDIEKSSIEALDAFVLAGAIKLWRMQMDPSGPGYRHHTMLVHESVKQAEHFDTAERFRQIWRGNGHDTARGLDRLRELFDADFVTVSEDRADGYPFPERFDDLIPFIARARAKVTQGTQNDPVVIVNGSKESDYDPLVFDTQDFWRILVGGAKLSRGFTIEGLTISYYRRRSLQEDTLLQMGRWFGYRPGYKDLVRLYIDHGSESGKASDNLYEAFKAIVQDEARFREQLSLYSRLGPDGLPEVQPRDVPPLVFLTAPWLKPTSRNKMFNSKIARIGEGGMVVHMLSVARPEEQTSCHRHNLSLLEPWFVEKEWQEESLGPKQNIPTRVAIVEAEEFMEVLRDFKWITPDFAEARLGYLSDEVKAGELTDFAVIIHDNPQATIELKGFLLPVGKFHRRARRPDFTAPSENIRFAAEAITGNSDRDAGPAEERLRAPGRGAIILSFGTENRVDWGEDSAPLTDELVPLISFATPFKARGEHKIAFVNKVEGKSSQTVVDVSEVGAK